MTQDGWALVGLVVSGVMTIYISALAQRRGRYSGAWPLFGFLFWPLTLPILLLAGRSPKAFPPCPHCMTAVDARASICPHCRGGLTPAEVPVSTPAATRQAPRKMSEGALLAWILVFVAAGLSVVAWALFS